MTSSAAMVQLPIDLSKGQWVVAIPHSDKEATSVLTVQQLLAVVPDPIASENVKRVTEDPLIAKYAELRKEVQRAVQGAKAKNARDYATYLLEGLQGRRPYMVPPVTLFHPKRLEHVALGNGVIALVLPYGDFFVAIDGETQRIAWQIASREFDDALSAKVKVVIHHGKTVEEARQGFYDLNTREVKPSAAISIAMDSQDLATQITRRLIRDSEVLRDRVNVQRRQLRQSDPEFLTISALRTGIVTTMLGPAGLQVGTRPVSALAEGVDLAQLEVAIAEVWHAILEHLEDELQPARRPHSIVSSPAVLAGVGILAHRTLPSPPRKADTPELTIDDVLENLADVTWERGHEGESSPWEGIAGKISAKGGFSVGGPKEVGHMVAEALIEPSSEAGRRVRLQGNRQKVIGEGGEE
jgi:DGQHR domain-containing protein